MKVGIYHSGLLGNVLGYWKSSIGFTHAMGYGFTRGVGSEAYTERHLLGNALGQVNVRLPSRFNAVFGDNKHSTIVDGVNVSVENTTGEGSGVYFEGEDVGKNMWFTIKVKKQGKTDAQYANEISKAKLIEGKIMAYLESIRPAVEEIEDSLRSLIVSIKRPKISRIGKLI